MDSSTHPPIRVLLVEEDERDAELVRQSLQGVSSPEHVLDRVASLQDGLVQLGSKAFDATLISLAPHDVSANDTLAVLEGYAEETPMVALLSAPDPSLAEQAMRRGAQECLIKNREDLAQLKRTLQHAIIRHQLTRPLRTAETQLRLLAEQLPALLWTTDAQLCFTSCRGGRRAAVEAVCADWLGKPVEELSQTTADAALNRRVHLSALAGEAGSTELRWAGRWYQAHVVPLRSAHGEVGGTIGVALDVTHERQMMKEIEAAHRVQQHLLPATEPRLAGFDIAGVCHPATDCSGDFFDYIPLPNERLAIVLSDVSGHGFGPAIMAAAIRSYLRTAAVLGNHVHEMLAIANRLLCTDAGEGPFASVFAVRLDGKSGSLQYTSAGHSALLLRRCGEVRVLETACVPIGVREDESFPVSRPLMLGRGDILLLASDGFFDTRLNGKEELFGAERTIEALRALWPRPAKEIVDGLYRISREFAGGTPPEDDVTIVVVKRAPPDADLDTDSGS